VARASVDTIFAVATPPGMGGVGILRVSGPGARDIARAVTGREPEPRRARHGPFLAGDGAVIDTGIALFFAGPRSFTGEDVLELQGHGSPVVLNMLGRRLAELGARLARPGEFSERAFLNDRLDLAQAEAIADLIAAETDTAARAAQRSLEGVFSDRVREVQAALTELRVFVEAALDFPDEEIDFIAESDVAERLERIGESLEALLGDARQGRVLRDGITVAIIGKPNAGKSSLLNALSGRDAAIVTDIPGTTRDVLRETVSLDGLPVHVADTAGIREAADQVEAEGVRRARAALRSADIVLLVVDASDSDVTDPDLRREVPDGTPCIEVRNKIDLTGQAPSTDEKALRVYLSAATGAGMDGLVRLVRHVAGLAGPAGSEGVFSARARHIDALRRTGERLRAGREQLVEFGSAETLAEELRLAQKALGEITGEFLPDDLLGAIFSSFCIGK
jgi:tRNA modification GTPase